MAIVETESAESAAEGTDAAASVVASPRRRRLGVVTVAALWVRAGCQQECEEPIE